MAPEMMSESTKYNEKVDIWALGISAINIASGGKYVPYSELKTYDAM